MAESELASILADLKAAADPERAKSSAWFFKTGKGQYGEGDKFIGITVPGMRKIARRHRALSFDAITKLMRSKIHEHRFVALEILVMQFEKGDEKQRRAVYEFYLANTAAVNNWDLVDTSAPYIAGEYLLQRPREVLYRLAKSSNLWERRIAIVSTFAFIRAGETADTFATAKLLLKDEHDLIHKAVGWALREAGKSAPKDLEKFLNTNYAQLPRTALRYAIERFPAAKRKRYLAGDL